MRRLAIIIATVLFGTASNAQTLRVQSGDHVGFTRLVIPIGAEREWELSQDSPEQWQLRLSPEVDGFDTSGAFELIQRDRLSELVDGSELTLQLACACAVTGFRHDSRYLVIDIANPDPESTSSGSPAPENPPFNGELEARNRASDALPNLASLLRGSETLPDLNAPAEQPATGPIAADTAIETGEPEQLPNPQLAEAAEIMAEQLSRAAAAGLLDSSLGQAFSFADPESEEPQTDLDGAPPPPAPLDADVSGDPGLPEPENAASLPIHAETALDFDIPAQPFNQPTVQVGACRYEPFAPQDWSDASSFDQGLGILRQDLYDERDSLSEDAALNLARHYLVFGFGAEANFWLNQVSSPPRDLLEIAALVDGAESSDFPVVTSPDDCSDGELLWRYLGNAVAADLNSENTAAVQRAFSALPSQLRDLMGARLAQQLSEDGHEQAALNVRNILDRGGRLSDGELQLLDLQLGIVQDATSSDTRVALEQLLMTNDTNPSVTMAQALAFDRSNGILPTPERIVAAEALLRENGVSETTDGLWRETLLAHASLGELDTSIRLLSDPERSQETRTEALTELISERVAVGDTVSLLVLAHTFGPEWRVEGSEAGRTQVAAISLLRAQGLFQAAELLREARESLILPNTDPRTQPVVDPAVEAWVNQDWRTLADTADGPHSEIASRLSAQTAGELAPASGPPDLQSLAASVSDSRTLRTTIEALLENPSIAQ